MKPLHYILIGFPRSGKSSLGKKLASTLALDWYDLDTLLENTYQTKYGQKVTCKAIWESEGEIFFRDMESTCFLDFMDINLNKPSWLLALGGGAPVSENIFSRLQVCREKGEVTVLYLDVSKEDLWQRMSMTHFPKSLDQENLEQSFDAHYTERCSRYRELADITQSIPMNQEKKESLKSLLEKVKAHQNEF